MTKKEIQFGSKVKHPVHGIGHITHINDRLQQCSIDFINGQCCVCPITTIKRVSVARVRNYKSSANKL